jgi:alcohol dehydrogenase
MLVRVPDGVDAAAVASASDNMPDGWRTVAPQLRQRPGAPVLVVGGSAASIGLYAAGIAVALGSERVDYLDHDRQRLEIAESLGAQVIEMPATGRSAWYRKNAVHQTRKYPITVDASAKPEGLRHAIRALAPGGVCTSVGYYFMRGTALPLMQMYANCSTFNTGMSHPRADLPELLALIASKRFQPEKVITQLAPWSDAKPAFLTRTTKVVVHRPRQYARPAA